MYDSSKEISIFIYNENILSKYYSHQNTILKYFVLKSLNFPKFEETAYGNQLKCMLIENYHGNSNCFPSHFAGSFLFLYP